MGEAEDDGEIVGSNVGLGEAVERKIRRYRRRWLYGENVVSRWCAVNIIGFGTYHVDVIFPKKTPSTVTSASIIFFLVIIFSNINLN